MIGADAGNGIRVFIPDIGMFVAGLAIWLLCRSLVQKRPPEDMAQYNADFDAEEQVGFTGGGEPTPSVFPELLREGRTGGKKKTKTCRCRLPLKDEEEKISLDDDVVLEEDVEAGYEAEEEEDEGNEEDEEEEEEKESTKTKILRLVQQVASKVKEIIGNLITTAGQVVVTILLGLTGERAPPCGFYLFLQPALKAPVSAPAGVETDDSPQLRVRCLCPRRYHAALADLCCVLLHLPVPLHLVVPLPHLRHAPLQLHVRPHGHFQRWTHHCPLPLPVPVLSGVHPARGQLDQVRRFASLR